MRHPSHLRALALSLAASCAPSPAPSSPAPSPIPAPTLAPASVSVSTSAPPPTSAPASPASAPSSPFIPKSFIHAPYPWQPDQNDGRFQNPVLYADYSDPDAIRVGDDYYMTASSFQCTPGLPILHSKDLVNWTLVGHALENLPDARYREVRHGEGIWAPALREHKGRFYIFAPTPDEGIYVLTAPHPKGPWSRPKMLAAGKGLIDPCPLWDDDGKAYLVHAYARSRAGIRDRLRVRPMAPDATRLLGEGEVVFMEPERQPTIEGPKFYKRNGWYYILAPAGGVPTGWQVALRSRSIYGPYEDRIVLAEGESGVNGPHQGALVETPRGQWWFLHFQDAGLYGRIVHLNPVSWVDDWPLMGHRAGGTGPGEPLLYADKPAGPNQPPAIPQTSDEFDAPKLGPQWQWHANHDKSWYSLTAKKGSLRLVPQPAPNDLSRVPNLLLQKLPASAFVAETVVHLRTVARGTRTGLVVMGQSHAAIVVEQMDDGPCVSLVVDNVTVEGPYALRMTKLALRVTMETGGATHFEYDNEYEMTPFMREFRATPGRWIGAKIGVFATLYEDSKPEGSVDFEYFRFLASTSR